ncbi:hypothetical protein RFI_37339 [Reticulomyxa filosa]|uniref:Uncharacterized protein n=1 Tax=Reticulomyxa filosa TaxID=46433 RepID=X6LHB3_RETFI|nr:hypothetical protein RFI_37339 [Reticulomyxa filosa]|eukprot:ETO00120.1 hypothetical protein RFI_37339 [Reticulomyxa filosa]
MPPKRGGDKANIDLTSEQEIDMDELGGFFGNEPMNIDIPQSDSDDDNDEFDSNGVAVLSREYMNKLRGKIPATMEVKSEDQNIVGNFFGWHGLNMLDTAESNKAFADLLARSNSDNLSRHLPIGDEFLKKGALMNVKKAFDRIAANTLIAPGDAAKMRAAIRGAYISGLASDDTTERMTSKAIDEAISIDPDSDGGMRTQGMYQEAIDSLLRGFLDIPFEQGDEDSKAVDRKHSKLKNKLLYLIRMVGGPGELNADVPQLDMGKLDERLQLMLKAYGLDLDDFKAVYAADMAEEAENEERKNKNKSKKKGTGTKERRKGKGKGGGKESRKKEAISEEKIKEMFDAMIKARNEFENENVNMGEKEEIKRKEMVKANELFRNAMSIENMSGYSYKTEVNEFMKKLVEDVKHFGGDKSLLLARLEVIRSHLENDRKDRSEVDFRFRSLYNLNTVNEAIAGVTSGTIKGQKEMREFFDKKADEFASRPEIQKELKRVRNEESEKIRIEKEKREEEENRQLRNMFGAKTIATVAELQQMVGNLSRATLGRREEILSDIEQKVEKEMKKLNPETAEITSPIMKTFLDFVTAAIQRPEFTAPEKGKLLNMRDNIYGRIIEERAEKKWITLEHQLNKVGGDSSKAARIGVAYTELYDLANDYPEIIFNARFMNIENLMAQEMMKYNSADYIKLLEFKEKRIQETRKIFESGRLKTLESFINSLESRYSERETTDIERIDMLKFAKNFMINNKTSSKFPLSKESYLDQNEVTFNNGMAILDKREMDVRNNLSKRFRKELDLIYSMSVDGIEKLKMVGNKQSELNKFRSYFSDYDDKYLQTMYNQIRADIYKEREEIAITEKHKQTKKGIETETALETSKRLIQNLEKEPYKAIEYIDNVGRMIEAKKDPAYNFVLDYLIAQKKNFQNRIAAERTVFVQKGVRDILDSDMYVGDKLKRLKAIKKDTMDFYMQNRFVEKDLMHIDASVINNAIRTIEGNIKDDFRNQIAESVETEKIREEEEEKKESTPIPTPTPISEEKKKEPTPPPVPPKEKKKSESEVHLPISEIVLPPPLKEKEKGEEDKEYVREKKEKKEEKFVVGKNEEGIAAVLSSDEDSDAEVPENMRDYIVLRGASEEPREIPEHEREYIVLDADELPSQPKGQRGKKRALTEYLESERFKGQDIEDVRVASRYSAEAQNELRYLREYGKIISKEDFKEQDKRIGEIKKEKKNKYQTLSFYPELSGSDVVKNMTSIMELGDISSDFLKEMYADYQSSYGNVVNSVEVDTYASEKMNKDLAKLSTSLPITNTMRTSIVDYVMGKSNKVFSQIKNRDYLQIVDYLVKSSKAKLALINAEEVIGLERMHELDKEAAKTKKILKNRVKKENKLQTRDAEKLIKAQTRNVLGKIIDYQRKGKTEKVTEVYLKYEMLRELVSLMNTRVKNPGYIETTSYINFLHDKYMENSI